MVAHTGSWELLFSPTRRKQKAGTRQKWVRLQTLKAYHGDKLPAKAPPRKPPTVPPMRERYSNAWDWEQGESIELTFWTHSFGVSFHHTPHNIVENHKKQPTELKGARFKDVQATQCVSWTEAFPRRERRTAVQVPFERKADSCG